LSRPDFLSLLHHSCKIFQNWQCFSYGKLFLSNFTLPIPMKIQWKTPFKKNHVYRFLLLWAKETVSRHWEFQSNFSSIVKFSLPRKKSFFLVPTILSFSIFFPSCLICDIELQSEDVKKWHMEPLGLIRLIANADIIGGKHQNWKSIALVKLKKRNLFSSSFFHWNSISSLIEVSQRMQIKVQKISFYEILVRPKSKDHFFKNLNLWGQ